MPKSNSTTVAKKKKKVGFFEPGYPQYSVEKARRKRERYYARGPTKTERKIGRGLRKVKKFFKRGKK